MQTGPELKVVSDSLELLVLLPLLPRYRTWWVIDMYYNTMFYVVSGNEPRASDIGNKYTINWARYSAQEYILFIGKFGDYFLSYVWICGYLHVSANAWGSQGLWIWNWSYRQLRVLDMGPLQKSYVLLASEPSPLGWSWPKGKSFRMNTRIFWSRGRERCTEHVRIVPMWRLEESSVIGPAADPDC